MGKSEKPTEQVVSPAALEDLKTMFRTLREVIETGANKKRVTQLLTNYEKRINSFTVLEVSLQMDLTDAKRDQRERHATKHS